MNRTNWKVSKPASEISEAAKKKESELSESAKSLSKMAESEKDSFSRGSFNSASLQDQMRAHEFRKWVTFLDSHSSENFDLDMEDYNYFFK